MGQPVKVSDALLIDARVASEVGQRSIAGQIEFWARLGRAIEPLLAGERVAALSRAGKVTPLSESLLAVDSVDGRRRVAEYLTAQPFPHFSPAPRKPGFLIKTEA